jgi:ribonuclease D
VIFFNYLNPLIIMVVTAIDVPNPFWVDTPSALQSLLTDLHQQAVIAVDTESNSLYAYRERVCLIQFSTPASDYLVDPLSTIDLSPLGEIFSSRTILKVFHAAEYDILCLRRDYGFDFNHIFDTMQAARILGKEKVGLGDQLAAEFGLHLDKHYQKADWAKRPLPLPMQSYACLDTHYLLPYYAHMAASIKTRGLDDLAQEDFARLCRSTAAENHKTIFSQVSGYQDLDGRQLAVLNELCLYRDQRARSADLPLFKVISDSALLAVANYCPANFTELQKVGGLSPRLRERYAEAFLQAVRRGLKAPEIRLKRLPRPDALFLERLENLKKWRKVTAQKQGVASDIVLPRDILEAIASRNPQGTEELFQCMQSAPWRFEQYGKKIIQVLKE